MLSLAQPFNHVTQLIRQLCVCAVSLPADVSPSLRTIRLEDSGGESSAPPRVAMAEEKRIRREIANSNERRRMQSINAGFQTLRSLLPQHEGEKLSKVCHQSSSDSP